MSMMDRRGWGVCTTPFVECYDMAQPFSVLQLQLEMVAMRVARSPTVVDASVAVHWEYGSSVYNDLQMSEELWQWLEACTDLGRVCRSKGEVQRWWGRRCADDLYTAHILSEYYWNEVERRRVEKKTKRKEGRGASLCFCW